MAAKVPAIDMHCHAIIPETLELVRGSEGLRNENERRARLSGAVSEEHNRKLMETVYAPKFAGVDTRLKLMDAMRIDVQAVSIMPNYLYWADRELAEKIVASNNQGIAELCRKRTDRLIGLGTVSLQHPDLAPVQLRHAMQDLGLRGVIISTVVNGTEISDSSYEPFWSAAEELGAVVFIHPAGCAIENRLAHHYLYNVIGNPLETTMALTNLVFSGTLDRHPKLKIVAAHGGGYFPFYTSRFDHGWEVRPEAHTCQHAPSHYLHRLFFDSLVYEPEMVGFLLRRAGASQVVLGTDYPFDMGIENPVECLEKVEGLAVADREAVVGKNAARLLGL